METWLPSAPSLTSIITMIGAVVGVLTFVKAVFEYVKQNQLKRFEKFQEMSRRFDDNKTIEKICRLVTSNSPELAEIASYEKEVVICFFEEIAVLRNSRILSDTLILNSFGYYAIKCFESRHFWNGLDENELFYSLFRGFCRDMAAERAAMERDLENSRVKICEIRI